MQDLSVEETERKEHQIVTVEPLIACFFIPHVLCIPAIEALEFDTACTVDAGYNNTVCKAILSNHHTNVREQNNHVQMIISSMYSWQFPVHNVIPIVLILFLGSYSDRHVTRKPFLLLPFIGEILAITGMIFCVIFKGSWSVNVQGMMHVIFPSLFGGHMLLLMGATAYITDVSTAETRTFRIGMIFVVKSLSYAMLNVPGGVLFLYLGYTKTFGIGCIIYMVGLCYGLVCIRDVKREGEKPKFFDKCYVFDAVKLLVKKRGDVNKSLLLYSSCVIFLSTIVAAGEPKVLWLFTQAVYDWTSVIYSYHHTVRNCFNFIDTYFYNYAVIISRHWPIHSVNGMRKGIKTNTHTCVMLLIPFFANVLKCRDTTILMVAFMGKILTNLVYIFVESVTGLYIAAIGSLFCGIAPVVLRSIATKCVTHDNVAKGLSLLALCEAIGNMLSTPIYNQGIYNHTLENLPEAFFFLGVVLLGLCFVITTWVRFSRVDKPELQETDADGGKKNESRF